MAGVDFEAAYPELFRLAYRVAYRVVGSTAEAEEIAQETLFRALARWSRICDHAAAWVAVVAMHQGIDVARRDARVGRLQGYDVATEAADADQRVDLVAALRRLPRRQRQVLACRYLAGLPDQETASLLGIAVGSVKQHAARGLQSLRVYRWDDSATVEGTNHA